jgi:hypothetical protein
MHASDKRLARSNVARKLTFLDYVTVHYTSALKGTGLRRLFVSVDQAWRSASRKMATSELNAILAKALTRNPPPVVRGRRIKLRYAHQGGSSPPLIVIHGNQTNQVPDNYRRYLVRTFRESLGLHGTPIQFDEARETKIRIKNRPWGRRGKELFQLLVQQAQNAVGGLALLALAIGVENNDLSCRLFADQADEVLVLVTRVVVTPELQAAEEAIVFR